MAIAPKKVKDLVRLFSANGDLRREIVHIVAETDNFVKEETLGALQEFMQDQDIDLRLMSHSDVTAAIKQYYKDSKIHGEFVKLY